MLKLHLNNSNMLFSVGTTQWFGERHFMWNFRIKPESLYSSSPCARAFSWVYVDH